MTSQYKHYGWQVSYYSGKTRSYLRYKQIPFVDIEPTMRQMQGELKRRVGFTVIPVVVTPEDETLQDTSAIIDWFESKYPENSVYPSSPKQHLTALLFELLGDEWLLLPAMHYRWNFPKQNLHFLQQEMGRSAMPKLFPLLPEFLQRKLISPVTNRLQGYCSSLGIVPKTIPAIEAWTEEVCDQLDAHFAEHDYLFGGRPSVGDYGLAGPFWAHLGRDPYPRDQLVAPRKHLRAWLDRVASGEPASGDWLADDCVPETLVPILQRAMGDFWPILEDTGEAIAAWVQEHPGQALPRGVGKHSFKIGGITAERARTVFNQWMAQRPLAFYQGLSEQEKLSTDFWLKTVGLQTDMQLQFPQPLRRENFRLYPV